jgi:hypothetical protein
VADELLVEVRDASYRRVGRVLPEHVELSADVSTSDVGEWNLSIPLVSAMAEYLMLPGYGIVVTSLSTSETLFSGPTTSIGLSYTSDYPRGRLSVSGVTDEVILRDALAWPEPGESDPSVQAVARDTRTGEPWEVILGFVDDNIGPSGSAERKNPYLILSPDDEFPLLDDIESSARFDQLLTLIQPVAKAANLSFRVLQVGQGLEFQLRAMGSDTIVAIALTSRDLASVEVTLEAPQSTRVFVGGDGSSTSRAFLEWSDDQSLAGEDEWSRRIEVFAAATGTTLQLQTAGKEALSEGGFTKLTARIEPTENMRQTYGTEWRLGDTAAINIGTSAYTAPINGLVVKADRDGFRLGALIGEVIKTGNQIEKRVSNLETYR